MHNACMPAITIRHVPPETRDVLAARAAAAGQSLQDYLLSHLIETARRPDPGTVLASIRARKEAVQVRIGVDEIVELREADRR